MILEVLFPKDQRKGFGSEGAYGDRTSFLSYYKTDQEGLRYTRDVFLQLRRSLGKTNEGAYDIPEISLIKKNNEEKNELRIKFHSQEAADTWLGALYDMSYCPDKKIVARAAKEESPLKAILDEVQQKGEKGWGKS